MDFIREIDLPGIGKKFSLTPINGGKIIIIVHDDGAREIYRYNEDEDAEEVVEHVITFEDGEARKVAGILGGLAYTPRALESVRVNLNELSIDWCKVCEGLAADKLIGELGVRKNYGISIIGINHKDGSSTVNPGPEARMRIGDTIVMAGKREQIRAFHRFLNPNSSGEAKRDL